MSELEFFDEDEALDDIDNDLPPEEDDELDELSKEFVKKLIDHVF